MDKSGLRFKEDFSFKGEEIILIEHKLKACDLISLVKYYPNLIAFPTRNEYQKSTAVVQEPHNSTDSSILKTAFI